VAAKNPGPPQLRTCGEVIAKVENDDRNGTRAVRSLALVCVFRGQRSKNSTAIREKSIAAMHVGVGDGSSASRRTRTRSFRSTPMTGSAEGLTISASLPPSPRIIVKRGPSFGLRLATRFPSTSGTANILRSAQGAINVMARTSP
jgi:hypothetical protein